MDWLAGLLARPLDSVGDDDVCTRFPEAVVENWRVDRASRRALVDVGLPAIHPGDFLPEQKPGIEAEVLPSGGLGYRLGVIRHLDVFVASQSGHVIAEPRTPGFGAPGVVNSSGRHYVETCWRYCWLQRELLARLEDEDAVDAGLTRFRQWVESTDPLTGAQPDSSLWPSLTSSWWG